MSLIIKSKNENFVQLSEDFFSACYHENIQDMNHIYDFVPDSFKNQAFHYCISNEKVECIVVFLKKNDLDFNFLISFILNNNNVKLLYSLKNNLSKETINDIFYKASLNQQISIMNCIIDMVDNETLEHSFNYVVFNLKINSLKFFTEKLNFDLIQKFYDNM